MLVVVDVLVVIPRLQSQLFPEYRHHACCPVAQYSSPTSGSVGGVAETNIFPVMHVACVSLICYTVVLVLELVLVVDILVELDVLVVLVDVVVLVVDVLELVDELVLVVDVELLVLELVDVVEVLLDVLVDVVVDVLELVEVVVDISTPNQLAPSQRNQKLCVVS